MSSAILPRLIVVTVHKAGAHLALRLVEEMGYRRRFFEDELIASATRNPADVFLREMEPNAAYFLHECRIDRFPRSILDHWRETDDPKFIYGYRDPRAVLLSQVNYLRRRHQGETFSNTPYHLVFSDALRSQPSESDALTVAIDCMGDYLLENFLGSVWMLHHPNVIRIRYERLVGAQGGGTDADQLEEVTRVSERLGLACRPEVIASHLYDRSQRTFHRGRIDSWREVYSQEQLRVFEQRYGRLLDIYGYPRASQATATKT